MDKLWAPWRYEYIKSNASENDDSCLFCRVISEGDDEKNLIIYRGRNAYIMLNRYPYNNGHLMIVPYNHLSEIYMLNDDEMLEVMKLSSLSVKVLRNEFSPEGFNIGLNLGKIAGAGIDEHLHIHIVPRWKGDTNFMPVIADTKVIPEALKDTYRRLREHISLLEEER